MKIQKNCFHVFFLCNMDLCVGMYNYLQLPDTRDVFYDDNIICQEELCQILICKEEEFIYMFFVVLRYQVKFNDDNT